MQAADGSFHDVCDVTVTQSGHKSHSTGKGTSVHWSHSSLKQCMPRVWPLCN